MAHFEVQELERQRYIRILLDSETVRAESGAFSYMRGKIAIDAQIPSPLTMLKCALSNEPFIRPRYSGTGEVFLNSTFGGFHVFDVKGESWILENGAYWCSDDSVRLGLYREGMLTSFWAGEGLVDYQTHISGTGKAVLSANGPVEEMELGDETIAIEDKVLIARTEGVRYSVGRPTRSIFSYWLSGEKKVRKYRGPGKVLLVWTPYFNQRLARSLGAQDSLP